MDEDGSGEIDFREFVVACTNYCCFDKRALTTFAFDLYDDDCSGSIEADELHRVIKEIYGSKALAKSPLVARVLGKMNRMLDNGCGLNAKQFVEFTNDHPALLFPAFQLQRELQKGIVGDLFWLKIAVRTRSRRTPRRIMASCRHDGLH